MVVVFLSAYRIYFCVHACICSILKTMESLCPEAKFSYKRAHLDRKFFYIPDVNYGVCSSHIFQH
jgi:hypothetical protein